MLSVGDIIKSKNYSYIAQHCGAIPRPLITTVMMIVMYSEYDFMVL